MACYLNHLGIINALGSSHEVILENLVNGERPGVVACDWVPDFNTYVANVQTPLPALPAQLSAQYQCRNNQLAWAALAQIQDHVSALKTQFDPTRIAVVIGTSTSGIAEGEEALFEQQRSGTVPAPYRYQQQEIGTVAEFIAEALDLSGPAYTISTACSSSGHAFNSAKSMLDNNIADAVIVGGVDSLCKLTVNGFAALESVSPDKTTPFSKNRKGINIGEAAALFIATKTHSENAVELVSVGSSSDAHHISAPEPEGKGAENAIQDALSRGGLTPSDINYINLHGTGTRLNDLMESKVVHRVFGPDTPCSSSKAQLGHSLGAAAANELGLCWLTVSKHNQSRKMPPHVWDGAHDDELASIHLTSAGECYSNDAQVLISNSFAFGGNNTAVIIRECRLDQDLGHE